MMTELPTGLSEVARISERSGAELCFGTPATAGERTVIPVAEVYYALAMGWGGGSDPTKGQGGGGGAGGGSRSRGVAVIEVSPDGVRVHAIRDATAITLAAIAFASVATAIVSRTLLKLVRG